MHSNKIINHYNELSTLMSDKKIHELKSYIDKLVNDNVYVGFYLKSIGQKHGLFGYVKNPDEARIFILENYVSY